MRLTWRLFAAGSFMTIVAGCSPGIGGDAGLPGGTQRRSYLVVYADDTSGTGARDLIARSGATVVAEYPAIRVALVTSDDPSFRMRVSGAAGVEDVAPTSATTLAPPRPMAAAPLRLDRTVRRHSSSDPLTGLQWDMEQIQAREVPERTGPFTPALVGILDSGIDVTHVDLTDRVDVASSVSCVSGAPDQSLGTWDVDVIGHGTHVGGIVAAAHNGVGIEGVAPRARLASIKVAADDGTILPEAFICGLMWAADHGVDVVNASLSTAFGCSDDATFTAIRKGELRALAYAYHQGVTVIAAAENDGVDLATDVPSNCQLLPVQLPGVIGVSAVGPTRQKAVYSNYGLDIIDLAAPGGDASAATADAPTGQVVSSIPPGSSLFQLAHTWSGTFVDCTGAPDADHCATYAALQGTSAAVPHVSGVAALIVERLGRLSPEQLVRRLRQSADPLPCPDNPIVAADGNTQTCSSHGPVTSFFGAGETNAAAAVATLSASPR